MSWSTSSATPISTTVTFGSWSDRALIVSANNTRTSSTSSRSNSSMKIARRRPPDSRCSARLTLCGDGSSSRNAAPPILASRGVPANPMPGRELVNISSSSAFFHTVSKSSLRSQVVRAQSTSAAASVSAATLTSDVPKADAALAEDDTVLARLVDS